MHVVCVDYACYVCMCMCIHDVLFVSCMEQTHTEDNVIIQHMSLKL